MRKTIEQLPINDNDNDAELSPRVLRPSNPYAPKNISVYSLKENQFVECRNSSNLILHVSKSGTLVKGGDLTKSNANPPANSTLQNLTRNQFEFNERGCETSNPPIVSGCVSTHPPPSKNHSGTVSRSIISDLFIESNDSARRNTAPVLLDDGTGLGDETMRQGIEIDLVEKQIVKSEIEPVYSAQMEISGIQMERILNFNCEQRIYQDLVQLSSSSTNK